MLRTKLLLFRANSIARKNRASRTTLKYQHARQIGIIFSIEDQTKNDIIQRFAKQLETDGKQVSVLSYLPKKRDNHEFSFKFFTKNDLSFWGHFTSNDVLSFAEKTFDYLLYIDHEPNPVFEGVLAMSKAKCRIGRFQENRDHFFEMMITTQNGKDTKGLIDEIYRYIKILG